jgi:hypothetical protein
MNIVENKLFQSICFGCVILTDLVFGHVAFWRAAGVLQLIFSINVIITRRVLILTNDDKPAGYVSGGTAILIGIICLCIALGILLFPELIVEIFGK